MQGRTATHYDPQWDTTKTAQEAGNTQLTGYFRWSRQVLGSNTARLGQRFTEPLGPIRSYAPGLPRLRETIISVEVSVRHASVRAGVPTGASGSAEPLAPRFLRLPKGRQGRPATTSAFVRTTNYRWRNLPALLGGLVQSRRSDLHVSTEPPPISWGGPLSWESQEARPLKASAGDFGFYEWAVRTVERHRGETRNHLRVSGVLGRRCGHADRLAGGERRLCEARPGPGTGRTEEDARGVDRAAGGRAGRPDGGLGPAHCGAELVYRDFRAPGRSRYGPGPGPGRLGEDTQGEETEDDPEDPESVLALIKQREPGVDAHRHPRAEGGVRDRLVRAAFSGVAPKVLAEFEWSALLTPADRQGSARCSGCMCAPTARSRSTWEAA
jgi:hypothetical protein